MEQTMTVSEWCRDSREKSIMPPLVDTRLPEVCITLLFALLDALKESLQVRLFADRSTFREKLSLALCKCMEIESAIARLVLAVQKEA